ncbi:MAG: hypothetical protein FVQ77_04295 [Cytophagales bacterium]|nr:hypothetical protein [Cytophagales bacterium]
MKPMTPKEVREGAIMTLDKGENIVGMWASPPIPQTGFYKLLAKQKKDGTIEWAHLVQRADGSKELMFRGTAKSKKELNKVVDLASAQLSRIFGPSIKLKAAKADFYSLEGQKFDDTVN